MAEYQTGLRLLLEHERVPDTAKVVQAIACFRDAWVTSHRPSAAYYIGYGYRLLNQPDEAKPYLQQAADKDYSPAHYALAQLLEGQGDLQALQHYCRAAKLGHPLAEERMINLLGIVHTADRGSLIELLRRN